jgi:hypothetical protein
MPVIRPALIATILLGAPAALAAEPATAPKAPKVVKVVLLDRFYRIDDVEFDRIEAVVDNIVDHRRPDKVEIAACFITTQDQVRAFELGLARRFSGAVSNVPIARNALECSWDTGRGKPRST